MYKPYIETDSEGKDCWVLTKGNGQVNLLNLFQQNSIRCIGQERYVRCLTISLCGETESDKGDKV